MVKAGDVSEPYLFSGYKHRSLNLIAEQGSSFVLEVDAKGDGQWQEVGNHSLKAAGHLWVDFPADQAGVWVRVKAQQAGAKVSAIFHYRNDDPRSNEAVAIFDGIATAEDKETTGGVMLARGAGFRTLRYVTTDSTCYDMGAAFDLKPTDDAKGMEWTAKNAEIPTGVLTHDEASILYVDEKGRWMLRARSELSASAARSARSAISSTQVAPSSSCLRRMQVALPSCVR
jgi:hypothetical protein